MQAERKVSDLSVA